MEVTALCIRLMIDVQFVLIALAQHSYCAKKEDAAFPHIHPTRLQFFEYESISLNCKSYNSPDVTVTRRLKENNISGNSSNWVISKGIGTINPAFSTDSGEYWCENKEGHKSNSVNITVTAGIVILESPVLPVKEGETLRLQCKMKNTSDLIAEFYKNGIVLKTGYNGYITIMNVSTCDEGFYKCQISGVGESPESWLAVIEPHDPDHPRLDHLPNPQTLLWIIISFSVVALLLLALGVTYCRKRRSTEDQSETSANRGDILSGPDSLVGLQTATYAVINKPQKKKDGVADPQNAMYATVKKPRKKEVPDYEAMKLKVKEEQDVFDTCTTSNRQEESIVYSSIK